MWECRVGHRLKTRGFIAFRRWQWGWHGQRKWGKGGRGYEKAAGPHTSALAAAELMCNNLFYAKNQLLSLLLSLQLSSAVLGIGESNSRPPQNMPVTQGFVEMVKPSCAKGLRSAGRNVLYWAPPLLQVDPLWKLSLVSHLVLNPRRKAAGGCECPLHAGSIFHNSLKTFRWFLHVYLYGV